MAYCFVAISTQITEKAKFTLKMAANVTKMCLSKELMLTAAKTNVVVQYRLRTTQFSHTPNQANTMISGTPSIQFY